MSSPIGQDIASPPPSLPIGDTPSLPLTTATTTTLKRKLPMDTITVLGDDSILYYDEEEEDEDSNSSSGSSTEPPPAKKQKLTHEEPIIIHPQESQSVTDMSLMHIYTIDEQAIRATEHIKTLTTLITPRWMLAKIIESIEVVLLPTQIYPRLSVYFDTIDIEAPLCQEYLHKKSFSLTTLHIPDIQHGGLYVSCRDVLLMCIPRTLHFTSSSSTKPIWQEIRAS